MRLECERGKGGRPPYGGSSFDPSTLTRLCDIPRHFFWALRSSRQDTAMLPISVHSSLLFDCLELKLGWIAWPVLRRGKRLVASLCCGPTHACMHLRHITCLIPITGVFGTPHQRGFLLFYQGFRRVPFSGWRSDCCPNIKRRGCKGGIAERHRSRTKSGMR